MQAGKPQILEIDGDKLRRRHAGFQKLLLDQLKHDRFPRTADAGHDLDEVPADKGADAAHIGFPFDHGISPLFLSLYKYYILV